jgi:hypothetical protein
MIETLLVVIVLLLVLLVFICGYILLHLMAKTEEKPPVPAKRARVSVRGSKETSALEKALEKFDGGAR